VFQIRGTQIPGGGALIFVGPQYGTCFTAAFWHLNVGGVCYILGKFMDTCLGWFVSLFFVSLYGDAVLPAGNP